ncbi:MAG TPA: ADP-forming succinate--CoA ligase subunit beta [Bacillota bacterium]|nr:ADP-forming succinate--CoA ligase subunit beta [Bacillota bacterium]
MKLYEYMGKELLHRYDVPIPRGKVVDTAEGAAGAAAELGEVVVKSQVLTGKRGKGGGIGFAATPEEARREAERILKVKVQGMAVDKLLVEEKLQIEQELYLAITVDGVSRCPVILASLDGGMDVEEVPEERMIRWPVELSLGLQPYMVREICRRLGGEAGSRLTKPFLQLLPNLYRLFREQDAELVEINPLALTPQGLVAADAKVTIDDDALYRHPEMPRIREKTDLELKAEELDLAYVELGGDIAVMANGAGITMATLDMVQYYGGTPANFLDFGGGAGVERTAQALELLLGTNPKAILINIFGGITRCDVVAEAFARVKESRGIDVPVSFRLVGTNEQEGREILKKVGIEAFQTMEEAVRHAVELSRG